MNKNLVIGIFLSLIFHGVLIFGFSNFNDSSFSNQLGESKIKVILKAVTEKRKNLNLPLKPIKEKRTKNSKVSKISEDKEITDISKSKNSVGNNTIIAKYLTQLRSEIVKNKYKNQAARIMKHSGNVELSFKVIWPNQIKDLKILSLSEFSSLNDSAIATIKRIRNVPRLPEQLKNEEVEVSIEVIYE